MMGCLSFRAAGVTLRGSIARGRTTKRETEQGRRQKRRGAKDPNPIVEAFAATFKEWRGCAGKM